MKLNQAGIDLIRQCEGCKLEAYQDIAGLWTIGIGHLVKNDEQFHPYGPITHITQREAEELLRSDLKHAEDSVRKLVTVPINDNQFSALVSFVYNVGEGAFAGSTLLKMLNASNIDGAETQFPKWAKARVNGELKTVDGLMTRRLLESMLFALPTS